jgi:hypothetical protein
MGRNDISAVELFQFLKNAFAQYSTCLGSLCQQNFPLFNTHPQYQECPHNFCFVNFCVKYTVWPEKFFWPQEASLRSEFIKHSDIHKCWNIVL